MPRFANKIDIDWTTHEIHIDGELFPFYIEDDPQAVSLLNDVRSLRIGILTQDLTVNGQPSRRRRWPSKNVTEGEPRHA